MTDLGFVHRFIPGTGEESAPVLLLLHGTGGNEQDLIPLGQALLPGAAILSLRGKVLENGMPRFFRRFAEGIFDVEDLKFRTDELSEFIDKARRQHGLRKNKLVAVGYSNGANIAASLIFLHPHHLGAAVLFRAMVPFKMDLVRDFSKITVFLGAGQRDPIVPRNNTLELAEILEGGGAEVAIHWHDGGHELGEDDMEAARLWLSQRALTHNPPQP
jgi:phospholipase/carboxylesterase